MQHPCKKVVVVHIRYSSDIADSCKTHMGVDCRSLFTSQCHVLHHKENSLVAVTTIVELFLPFETRNFLPLAILVLDIARIGLVTTDFAQIMEQGHDCQGFRSILLLCVVQLCKFEELLAHTHRVHAKSTFSRVMKLRRSRRDKEIFLLQRSHQVIDAITFDVLFHDSNEILLIFLNINNIKTPFTNKKRNCGVTFGITTFAFNNTLSPFYLFFGV